MSYLDHEPISAHALQAALDRYEQDEALSLVAIGLMVLARRSLASQHQANDRIEAAGLAMEQARNLLRQSQHAIDPEAESLVDQTLRTLTEALAALGAA